MTGTARAPLPVREGEREPLSADLVERAMRELAYLLIRRRQLPSRRLNDAQWGILLHLYLCTAEGRTAATGALAMSAGVPTTTLLRYLDDLEERRLITRAPAENDRRNTLVAATDLGLARIASILGEMIGAEQFTSPDPAPSATTPPMLQSQRQEPDMTKRTARPNGKVAPLIATTDGKAAWTTPSLTPIDPTSPKYALACALLERERAAARGRS